MPRTRPTAVPAEGQDQALPQDHLQHASLVRPDCHADSDLARAAADRISDQSIESNHGENERHHAHARNRLDDDVRRLNRALGKQILHGTHVEGRHVRIDAVYDPAQNRRERRGIARR